MAASSSRQRSEHGLDCENNRGSKRAKEERHSNVRSQLGDGRLRDFISPLSEPSGSKPELEILLKALENLKSEEILQKTHQRLKSFCAGNEKWLSLARLPPDSFDGVCLPSGDVSANSQQPASSENASSEKASSEGYYSEQAVSPSAPAEETSSDPFDRPFEGSTSYAWVSSKDDSSADTRSSYPLTPAYSEETSSDPFDPPFGSAPSNSSFAPAYSQHAASASPEGTSSDPLHPQIQGSTHASENDQEDDSSEDTPINSPVAPAFSQQAAPPSAFPEGTSSRPPPIQGSPPYPWATDRIAYVHPLHTIKKLGITSIEGKVICKKCRGERSLAIDLQEGFEELHEYFTFNKASMYERASEVWKHPRLDNCTICWERESVKPIIDELCLSHVNWLFLALTQTLGFCTLPTVKYFCQKTGQTHTTGSKERSLYKAYVEILNQLNPEGRYED